MIVLGPDRFRTIRCPSYPEIRLAVTSPRRLGRMIDACMPAAIHLATEGPLGVAARFHCRRRGHPFTTAYHTRFPEYVRARWRVPIALPYAFVRWFHSGATRTMVATPSIEAALRERGIARTVRWSRGVDLELFRPRAEPFLKDLPRPLALYVGRVAVEKNIEAFLAMPFPGSKVVVGDGPQLAALKAGRPEVRFLGAKHGEELARHYAAADVFVFPSRTDTFGLVMLEALACGTPVAGFPVPGPLDVIGDSGAGILADDLGEATRQALAIPRDRCRAHAETFSWEASAEQFLGNLQPFR